MHLLLLYFSLKKQTKFRILYSRSILQMLRKMESNKDKIRVMKRATLLIICFLLQTIISAQGEFVATWKTVNPGSNNSTSVPISGAEYNYGVAGIYTVTIRDTFPQTSFLGSGNSRKIFAIEHRVFNIVQLTDESTE